MEGPKPVIYFFHNFFGNELAEPTKPVIYFSSKSEYLGESGGFYSAAIMAEGVVRWLREGRVEGEHAPALCIEHSLLSPLGSHALRHFLTSLLSLAASAASQPRGVILLAFDRNPSFYLRLFDRAAFDAPTPHNCSQLFALIILFHSLPLKPYHIIVV